MQKQNFFDTIVIGSGIAGVSAAHELAQDGRRVLVLEANDYIGGRMKTVNVKLPNNGQILFEQGANWIHGSSKKNPITQLSKLVPGVKLIQTDDESITVYDQNGKEVDKQVQKQYDQYEKMLDKIESMENMTVYKALQKLNPKKVQNKFFMYNIASDVQFETSSSIENLSAQYGQDDSKIDGTQMLVLSGYQNFVEHLNKHEKINVLLNHKVVEVKFNGKTSVVKCQNGKIFQAENVVIAVPIGVLKKKAISFVPQLPKWKEQAIQAINFGNVCKILILLKNGFKVESKEQYFGVVADDVNKRGAATFFLNIQKLGKLNALMTFGLGPNSDELEKMPQNQLKQLIVSRLKIIIDQEITVSDFDIKRSTWRTSPNIGGAYSYSGVNTSPNHWKNMSKPVFDNNWYFCGQHTHSDHRGTVHGAYLSGKTTGSSIIEELEEKSWVYLAKSQE